MEVQSAPLPPEAPSLPSQYTPTAKKRNHAGEFVDNSTSCTPALNPQQSSPLTGIQSRSGSPALSRASTPLTDLGDTPLGSPSRQAMAPNEAKKRKLTFAEKEVEKAIKKREKEEKDKLKAEARAKREEERARKDEDKKRKEEEKEAVRKAREEKKKEKDAVKERKAAEEMKKERAQMRLGAFFGRPAPASTPPASSPDDVSMGTPSRRGSLASIDMEPPLVETKTPSKPNNPEYSSWILPFFVGDKMELAPFNRFHSHVDPFNDEQLQLNLDIVPAKISTRFPRHQRGRKIKQVKKILEEKNEAGEGPIDLTKDDLDGVPYKYLFFHQDIRPAYHGTYTRAVSRRASRKLALKPSCKELPGTDYDYDSEAEWQEPEEGDDDLGDEDEKSEDEDVDEEMDDFLDDEGDVAKRALIVSDMEPKSSGLCWQGEDNEAQNDVDLSAYRMDVLHDSTVFPIDPYSSTHWSDIGKPSPRKRETKPQPSDAQPTMQPPRLPLMAVDGNSGKSVPACITSTLTSTAKSENKTPNSKSKAGTSASGKPVKTIPSDLLPAFKDAVSGSTLTKTGLIEVLKNQFPKCSKDAIKHTLGSIAERKGAKEIEKKWVLLD